MGNIKIPGHCKELDPLTDKQRMFVLEYVGDMDAKRAATEAGYATPGTMGPRLMAKPKILKAVQALLKPKMKDAGLTADAILQQLHNFLFRDIGDFVDSEGYLSCDPSDLPEHARQCIDGWEAEIDYDDNREPCGQRIKVKLVSKAKAIELAMKYRNLLQPETQVQVSVGMDWKNFYEAVPKNTIDSKMDQIGKE